MENLYNKIEKKLKLINKEYNIKGGVLSVDLAKGLKALIEIDDEGRMEVKSQLVPCPWNPISGFYKSDLVRSLRYGSILLLGAFIIASIAVLDGFKIPQVVFFLTILVGIHLNMWYLYYFITFSNFKSQVENWLTE